MKLDVLVAEIGSTTTVVNGFLLGEDPRFVGAGQAPTSVLDGDVTIGLSQAIEDLRDTLGADALTYDEMLATSSAAGGLKMTVHGLVYDMTVRAAKEAALGAGANIHMVTAGRLHRTDLAKIEEIQPNIILLAGGVDYGERETAIANAEKIADLGLDIPIIYAGNVQNQEEMKLIFEESPSRLYLVDNVYPRIDQLNVEPTRKVIQEVFEAHITHAPGMAKVREMVSGSIIPTPAGVMEATKVLSGLLGDVVTVDVGGATTDIHSVTDGSEEIARLMIAPEPKAKRTVEGDLGVFINAENIIELTTASRLAQEMGISQKHVDALIKSHKPMPKTDMERRFVEALTYEAAHRAIERHAGNLIDMFSTSGRKQMAQGKDLTAVAYIVGTGGALTKLSGSHNILRSLKADSGSNRLLPGEGAKVLSDSFYIMASVGVLCKEHKGAAEILLRKTLNIL